MTGDSSRDGRRSSINRRRFIAAAGAAGVAGLAGCSGGGGGEETTAHGTETTEGGMEGTTTGQQQETVTLRLWSGNMTDEPANKTYWENAAQRANEKFNDFQIELRGVPYEGQFNKIRSAVQAGPESAPHIVEMASRKDTMLAADLLRIGDMYEGSEVQQALSPGLANLQQAWGEQMTGEEGAIINVPIGVRPYMNVYRQNWLDSAGLSVDDVSASHSWDKMFNSIYPAMKNSDKFKPDQGTFPDTTGMKEGDEEFLSHYAGQWGLTTMGTLNDAATHSLLDTKEYRDLIKFQVNGIDKQFFHSNSINHGDEEATTLIWNDQLGMIHVQDVADLWGSFKGELGADTYEQEYTWSVPNHANKKSTYGLVPIFVPFAEAYTSQAERDAFMKFTNWFATGQEAVRRTKNVGFVPPDPSALEADWFSSTSLHEKFWSTAKATLENFQVTELPAIEGGSRINFEIPRQMHQRILQQGMSVKEATKIAAEEQNNILRQNGRYKPR
ncbi:MAG: ABC transporter substrate-binding protein [Haloferacaceae archaeon]